MKDWIPLLQSLVWPVFLVGLAVWFRRGVAALLEAIGERVRSGAPFEAGPHGIRLGAVQDPAAPQAALETTRVAPTDGLPHAIYLTHRAWRDPSLDKGGRLYFRLRIWLEADDPALLDDIERVVYHLHPTFRNPDRIVTDRTTDFEIWTAAWGEFNMTAEILRPGQDRLVVERYINF